MSMLLLLTAALTSASPTDEASRLRAAQVLEQSLAEAATRTGAAARLSLESGIAAAVGALGADSEVGAELARLERGARFQAFLAGGDGASWLAEQLPPLVSDLRFEPVREADLPAGFPEWTPVGEIRVVRYPGYRMARTPLRAAGGNGAFWRLFAHIQCNDLAMTAPVETRYTVEGAGVDAASMAFLYGAPDLGRLVDGGQVQVVDVPAQHVVSIGMRGAESAARVAEAREKLARWLRAQERWVAVGEPRSMGHNSPMVQGDRRYFEVQMEVQRTAPLVVDFGAQDEARRWSAVDDTVMGGRSASRLSATPDGTSAFAGELSLENNGGFASVRRELDPGALDGAESVRLRVRGDGQTYRLRFRTEAGRAAPSYQADFDTVAGEWVDVTLELADFELKWRGRAVRGATPLEPAAVRGVGLLIGDAQEGPFRLELASLRKVLPR